MNCSKTIMDCLKPYLENLGLQFTDEQMEALGGLGVNLLADPLYGSVSKIFDPQEIATKHILDSLSPLSFKRECWEKINTILDLGTGGGFPALPLAIAFPQKMIYALDAKGKSVDFVERIKVAGGIKNLKTILGRAEELGRQKDFREKMDLVVCRAVAPVRVLIEICLPLVKIGGFALFYKGPTLKAEIAEANKAFHLLAIKPQEMELFFLSPPILPFERGYVLISKKSATPHAYPRRNGMPASQPL